MARIDGCTRDRLLEISSFQLGMFPFKYLGISLAIVGLHITNYSTLIDTAIRCLTSWTQRSLSYVEKLELVRTTLQGFEFFWLSILLIPNDIVDKLYFICNSFIWTWSNLIYLGILCVFPRRKDNMIGEIFEHGTQYYLHMSCGTSSRRKTLFVYSGTLNILRSCWYLDMVGEGFGLASCQVTTLSFGHHLKQIRHDGVVASLLDSRYVESQRGTSRAYDFFKLWEAW